MKAYKGFDKNLKCRNFQYEIGKTYEEPTAKLCNRGFHACEAPLDVFNYYAPADGSRYCAVDLDGVSPERDSSDSKVAATKITVGAEIGIVGLVKAHIEYVKSRTTSEHTDPEKATAGNWGAATAGYSGAATAGYSGAATAGDSGAATAGNWGAATAGNWGAATAGNWGAATAGKNGIAVCNGGKVRGGMGAVLVIAERDDEGRYLDAAVAHVDGEKIKADTWYRLKNGEFVEVEE